MKNIKKVISNNYYILKYIFKFIPLFACVKTVVAVIDAVLFVLLYAYSFKYVIDGIELGKSFYEILLFLVVLLGAELILQLLKKIIDSYYRPIAYERLSEAMQSLIHTKAIDVDMTCYDSSQYYHEFILATENADKRAIAIFDTIVNVLAQIVSIGSLVGIIASIDYIGLVFVIGTTIAGIVVNSIFNKVLFERDISLKSFLRKRDYTSRIFYVPEYAKELRTSKIKIPIFTNFHNAINEIIFENKKFSKKLVGLRILNYLVTSFMTDVVYLALLVYRVAVLQTLSIGSFVALELCMDKLSYYTQEFMDTVSDLHQHSLFAEKFIHFMQYENTVKNYSQEKPPTSTLSFQMKNVSFSYPGNSKDTLTNINLSINKGEKIAIVGYNGAGKSTLIKLLLRLYDTTEGEIIVDGQDIKSYSLLDYRKSIGTVFQDYHIYAANVAENISMDSFSNTEREKVKLEDAIKKSGFATVKERFADDIDAKLGSELFDEGEMLSGGESQKIALARVFYGDYTTVIFDEAVASLDPISEYEFYKSINEKFKNSTTIMVSHRLTATRDADKIFVLSGGKIIEEGSHAQLMNINGDYAKLFRIQAEKYCLENI